MSWAKSSPQNLCCHCLDYENFARFDAYLYVFVRIYLYLGVAASMEIFEVPQSLSKFFSLMIKSYDLKSSERVLGNALKFHKMSQSNLPSVAHAPSCVHVAKKAKINSHLYHLKVHNDEIQKKCCIYMCSILFITSQKIPTNPKK
jgi:hypothetical protein